MPQLLREPFVHFVVLGALLFGLRELVREEEPPPEAPPMRVSIKAEEAQMISLAFTERNERDPSEEELAALLAQRVDEELLYLEGMANGLNLGDPVVRRRVVQKQRFLLEELNPSADPTQDEISARIEADPERYRQSQALAFTHHFFDDERREDAEEDARRAMVLLDAGDGEPKGDPFPLGAEFGLRSLDSHRTELGPAFAGVLAGSPVGKWSLASSRWGWHLVRVGQRVEAGELAEESVREQARYDLLQEGRAAAVESALDEIRGRYEVEVEGL